MRRWSIRVAQEFHYDCETADEALAMAEKLKERQFVRCALIDARAALAPISDDPEKGLAP